MIHTIDHIVLEVHVRGQVEPTRYKYMLCSVINLPFIDLFRARRSFIERYPAVREMSSYRPERELKVFVKVAVTDADLDAMVDELLRGLNDNGVIPVTRGPRAMIR